jgi:hypothetical protein
MQECTTQHSQRCIALLLSIQNVKGKILSTRKNQWRVITAAHITHSVMLPCCSASITIKGEVLSSAPIQQGNNVCTQRIITKHHS